MAKVLDDKEVMALRVTRKGAGPLLGLTSRRHTLNLEQRGWIKFGQDGTISVFELVQGYAQSLKEGSRERRQTDDAKLRELKIQEHELELAERKGKVVEFKDVTERADSLIGSLFSDLEGLPAALFRDLKERKRVRDYIDHIRNTWAKGLRDLARANV